MPGYSLDDVAKSPTDATYSLSFSIFSAWSNLSDSLSFPILNAWPNLSYGMIGDPDDLFTEVDLDLLARRGLEPDSGQRPGPFLLTQGRHGPLQGPQVDIDPSRGQFLLNDGSSGDTILIFSEM